MLQGVALAWLIALTALGQTHSGWQYTASAGWWMLLLGAAGFLFWRWYRRRSQHWRGLAALARLLVFAAVVALVWQSADQRLNQRLDQRVSQIQKIDGLIYVDQLSEGQINEWRQPVTLLIPEHTGRMPRSIQILLYPKRLYNDDGEVTGLSSVPLQPGQYYQVTLQLKPPHGMVNAGSFDQEKWLLEQNIQGTGTLLLVKPVTSAMVAAAGHPAFVRQQDELLPRWRLWVTQQRLTYRQALLGTAAVGQNSSSENAMSQLPPANQSRAMLLGLLTGDRSGISRETTQLYQVMGISHLLAISGPHVLLLATLITSALMFGLHLLMRRGIGRDLYQRVPRQLIFLPLFMLLVTFYAAFSGFDLPAMRTWLMAVIASTALWLRIRLSTLDILSLGVIGVLWWDGFAILSAGFWLSFGAAAILLMIYQRPLPQDDNAPPPHWRDRTSDALQTLWQSQWRISVALLPLVLWQFSAVSLIAPLINLIAIVLLGAVIAPLNLIAAMLWQLWSPLGQLLWSVLAGILSLFEQLLFLIKPLADVLYWPSYLTLTGIMALAVALAIVMLPNGVIPRWWAACFGLLALVPHTRPLLQIDVLDVGQGQAVVVRTRHHQMMIDTGMGSRQPGVPSMGDRVDVPFLRRQGIHQLDRIVLSHLDADHSGGTAAVIEQIRVKRLTSNEADPAKTTFDGVAFDLCERGQQWQWDEVNFTILAPQPGQSRQNQNEASCVVLISAPMLGRTFKVLVMGDAGWEAEYYLLQQDPELTADVMVLGHHGSKHSSSYDFLAQISPQLAVISAGYDNRYGHPSPQTLARLQDLNIPAANTADLGAIHLQLDRSGQLWHWQASRSLRRWWWPSTASLDERLRYGSTVGLKLPDQR